MRLTTALIVLYLFLSAWRPADAALLNYWNFDNSGDVGQATVGTNLTASGDAQYTAGGYSGGGLLLDGNGDYLGGSPTVATGDSTYTTSAWIKPVATGNRGIVGWGNYGAGSQVNAFRIGGDNDLVNYWWGADISRNANAASVDLDDGNWHHVAASYTGGSRTLYADGKPIGSDSPGVNNASAANFRVGSTNNGEYFDGTIDDVATYNHALAPNQIRALAAGAAPNALPDADYLAAHWVADDYTTAGANWVDRVAGIAAVPGSTPLPHAAGVQFDGVDDRFTISAGDNPIAGLNEFTATVIFMADGQQGQGGDSKGGQNAFWASAHLMGNEQGGAGAGDWGIGLDDGQDIRAGVGLQGDVTLETAGPFDDGNAHIATMVMDADNSILKLFVDGVLETSTAITPNTTIDSAFFLGTNGAPAANDLFYFNGHLSEAALHEVALEDATVLAIHEAGTLVETVIPEPSTFAVWTLGLLFGLYCRRSRR